MTDKKLNKLELNEPEVLEIKDIFKIEKLTIPDYQRPYKWQALQVNQLLDDLKTHFEKDITYRIGTMILHSYNQQKDIVDGQQRLTTLSLLLHQLDAECVKNYINVKEFKHKISFINLYKNNKTIEVFLTKNNLIGNKDFLTYILKCEIVVITLESIDEAFQFFDAQNARGKSLAPYDLLKAYHLRVCDNSQDNVSKLFGTVETWEKAVSPEDKNDPSLNLMISKLLYRLKRWQEQKEAECFTSKELAVFKGVNKEEYPYLALLRREYQSAPNKFIHQIYQPIFNGQFFFDYIQYYRVLYTKLFHKENGKLAEIFNALDTYDGSHRIGDRYIKNLFICTTLFYADKFGKKQEDLEIVAKLIAQWAYALRFEYWRVSYTTIENHATNSNGLLFHILQSKTVNEVLRYTVPAYPENFKNCKGLKKVWGEKYD